MNFEIASWISQLIFESMQNLKMFLYSSLYNFFIFCIKLIVLVIIEKQRFMLAKTIFFQVKPGGKIPCDGQVIYGSSSISEAMITGDQFILVGFSFCTLHQRGGC